MLLRQFFIKKSYVAINENGNGKMINVTEELNKINELIKTNGKLSAKDRNAIPQMEMPTRDAKKRAREMDEVALGYSAEQAIVEANRCLQCAKPFCMDGCPVNINIPAFIHEVKEGNIEDFKIEQE